jgi:hypothetical protein
MFDNIKLFSKKDNKVQEPNCSWTEQTVIHCSFELNLGFGTDKLIWDIGNSIKLKKLIGVLTDLNKFVVNSDTNEYTFSLKNNDNYYIFNWETDEKPTVNVFRQYYESKTFLMKKSFNLMDITNFTKLFFIDIINILSNETNNEVTTNIGELFHDRHNSTEFEFKIGQKVETVVGLNVKTERKGIIANKWYHDKEKTTMYQLLIDNQILDKRYLPTDLKLIE